MTAIQYVEPGVTLAPGTWTVFHSPATGRPSVPIVMRDPGRPPLDLYTATASRVALFRLPTNTVIPSTVPATPLRNGNASGRPAGRRSVAGSRACSPNKNDRLATRSRRRPCAERGCTTELEWPLLTLFVAPHAIAALSDST